MPVNRGKGMAVILIVEDEVLAGEYLEFVLQKAGYEVVNTASAEEAIAVLEHRRDISLIITDINLPGLMNGLKLAAAVKDRWPPINIIIVTGYSAPESDEIPAGSLFVAKPYDAQKMVAAVHHFQ
jgi:two-component system, response regulator PdtaR